VYLPNLTRGEFEMSQQPNSNTALLHSIDHLDDLLSKSQIVTGGNSERREWAGSQHTDEKIPSPAPDGTSYQPDKPIAHKSIAEMSNEEIQSFLELRKSGLPNVRAAEAEIERLPGVHKSICGDCVGVGQDVMRKSRCGNCAGHGIVFAYPDAMTGQQAMAIADKYNCGPNSISKSQPSNEGGARAQDPDASSVPKTMTDYNPDKKGETSQDVAKGGGECDEDLLPEEGEEWMKSLRTIQKGLHAALASLKEQGARLAHVEQLATASGRTTSNMAKSFSGYQGNPDQSRVPARGPMAQGHGLQINPQDVQVLNKSQGPGLQQQPQEISRDQWTEMKKSATALVYEGKLDPGVVLRMDTDQMPTPEIMQMIQERMHAGRQQAPQQNYYQ